MTARGRRRSLAPVALAALLAAATLGLAAAPAVVPDADAATGDVGYEGPSSSGAGPAATGEKPESKLWFAGGAWWAVLFDPRSGEHHIFRLDLPTQTWADTGVAVDDRPGTRADALWTGDKLYVASHVYSRQPKAGNPARLYRYSFDPGTRTWTLDPGFPARINDVSSETLVIDRDSTGALWATWIQGRRVRVARTDGDDARWGAPFVPPVAGTSVHYDDISAVVSFAPGRIGLMWSNQAEDRVYFAEHRDGDPATAWEASRTAIQGPGSADDHVNLKSIADDGAGRVFAVVKTGMTGSSSPLIVLLARDTATGSWSRTTVGRVQDHHTRPVLAVDREHRALHVFATAPEAGGTIYEKVSDLDRIGFETGLGTPVIRDASSLAMNNATTTKQPVSSQTGLVVLASNDATGRYWHHWDPLGGGGPAPTPTPTPSATPGPTPTPAPSATPSPAPSANPTPSPSASPDPTASPAPGFLTFTPTADGQVVSTSPDRNYGTGTRLTVRDGGTSSYTFRSYLRFAVTGLAAAPRRAVLRLFVADPGASGGTAYPTSGGWSEASLTWNTAPVAAGGPLATAGTAVTGAWVEWDVTAAILGNGEVNLMLAGGSGDSVLYDSREAANDPQLVVTP